MSNRLILASASPIRKTLLTNAGIAFETRTTGINEEALKQQVKTKTPAELALYLAKAKALGVKAENADLIIAADQILALGNTGYDKVESLKAAAKRLSLLSGKTHQLIGATVLARGGKIIWAHQSTADLQMRELDQSDIDAYLKRAGPGILNSVGCYEMEGLGVTLFEKIVGDYFSILGLALLPLLHELRRQKAITP
jgi:nucleoside triphosphate pyrophosphatase